MNKGAYKAEVKGFEGLVFRGWGLGFGGVEVRHEEYWACGI